MSEVTFLLEKWRQGDNSAAEELFPLVYDELRGVAAAQMKLEEGYHTLSPTALIHEAFLRLVGQDRSLLKKRAQFFALAARMMRRVLVDHARERNADKRGGAARRTTLSGCAEIGKGNEWDLLIMDDALESLAGTDIHLCRIVELKIFAGFKMDEIAYHLEMAPATVYRKWKVAKARLFHYFEEI